ncbi:unnamed protein product [Bursaphelenchus xylophilus]|uniref:(pine wood nematode) hypothetical protein n=1 Tax=Bursaphelenchus xylophilus TaxID=6326 RepID=A0A1I7RHT6_BURXY|nr:unnamed protein product [Bursaphelenchus xylophilus]CAG9115400.1 unnamed protein product [Bursaphelenchus xylophilus]
MSSQHFCTPSTSTLTNSPTQTHSSTESSTEFRGGSYSSTLPQNSSTLSDDSTTSTCSELDIEDDQTRTWALCPIGYDKAIMIASFIAIYASLFLFYAQHHIVVLLVMTALIMFWVVCLFTSGMLCVIYLMLRISKMELGDVPEVETIVSSITVLETVVIRQDSMDEPVEVKV